MKRGWPLRMASASGISRLRSPESSSSSTSRDSPVSAMMLSEEFSTSPSASPSAPTLASLPGPVSAAVTSSTVTARDIALVVRSTMLVWRWRCFSRSRTKAEWAASIVASRTIPTSRWDCPSADRRIRAWRCVHWLLPSSSETRKWILQELLPLLMASSIVSFRRSRSAGSSRSITMCRSASNVPGSTPNTISPASSMSSVRASRSHSKLPVRFRARRSAVPSPPLCLRTTRLSGWASASWRCSWSVIPPPEIARPGLLDGAALRTQLSSRSGGTATADHPAELPRPPPPPRPAHAPGPCRPPSPTPSPARRTMGRDDRPRTADGPPTGSQAHPPGVHT
ncbi:hypothetical protein ACVWXU_001386 [Streptomyces sp. TE33382]